MALTEDNFYTADGHAVFVREVRNVGAAQAPVNIGSAAGASGGGRVVPSGSRRFASIPYVGADATQFSYG